MVKPKMIVIGSGQAGQLQILIPEFAGYDLTVHRRGIGNLLDTEVNILPQGGFSLVAPDQLYEGEVYTITPYKINENSPFWEPQQFIISGPLVGADKLVIPQFAGYSLSVNKRGVGDLTSGEFTVLPEGGFQLTSGAFLAGEAFTVTAIAQEPYPTIFQNVFNRYPHRLTSWKKAESTQNANGNWVTGYDIVIDTHCRAEVRTSSDDGLIDAQDGKVTAFSFTLYFPVNGPSVGVGAKVNITDADGSLITSDTIKRFSRGQLQARAWL
jgi:hypothetical protein